MGAPPSRSTLFPYTTLFRSFGLLKRILVTKVAQELKEAHISREVNLAEAPKHPGYVGFFQLDRKSTRLNSSHITISYAVFCLKKKRWRCATSRASSDQSADS